MAERLTSRPGPAAAILDILPSAVILAGCDRQIRYLNDPAEAVLESRDILYLVGDRLAAASAESHDDLRSAVEQVCDVNGDSLKIVRLQGRGKETYLATVTAHSPAKGDRQALIIFRLRRREAIAEQLKGLFALTKAEAGLALRLADGSSLQEIADARGIRLSTARAQLRSVFAKFDCSRQAQIVSIIDSLVLPFRTG